MVDLPQPEAPRNAMAAPSTATPLACSVSSPR